MTRQINEYLFYEFGFDEADAGRVSENWPFELKPVGRFVVLNGEMIVFEFADEGETYFALDGPNALSFLRSSGMSPEDIRTQQVGATWIGEREPVDLGTARIGYEGVPTAGERRVAITRLVAEAGFREPSDRIAEGLFLQNTLEYLVLVEHPDGTAIALGSNIPVTTAAFPEASAWRRLSHTIGQLIERGELGSD